MSGVSDPQKYGGAVTSLGVNKPFVCISASVKSYISAANAACD